MVPVVRRQALQELLACTHVMAVLELRLVAASPLVAVLLPGARVARASGRPLAQLTAQAVRPALLALLVLHLLLVDYLGKVAAAVVQVMQALVVQVVLEAVAQAAVVVAQHAVHTPLALVV